MPSPDHPQASPPAVVHCTPGRDGALTVLLINLCAAEMEVSLGVGSDREMYRVTADGLRASEALLGGTPLRLRDDGTPPTLAPEETTDPIALPAHSYAFVVIPDAAAPACGAGVEP